jgi:hypothetical protein
MTNQASTSTRCGYYPLATCEGSFETCPGKDYPSYCVPRQRGAGDHSPRPTVDPAVRDRVNACPDRGGVLPLSMQDDCGCQGKELSECRAGKGKIPGRVTLRECLACCQLSVDGCQLSDKQLN